MLHVSLQCRRALRTLRSRRGAMVALVAVLMPVMVGLVAVSVDVGVTAAARAQMQTATDASALSAAYQLASDRRVQMPTSLTQEIAAAQAKIDGIASRSRVLTTAPVFQYTQGQAQSSDVIVGYLNPSDHTSSTPNAAASPSTYNSVKVIGHRDAQHGGVIPAFFGGLFQHGGAQLTVSSTATVELYKITGFKPTNNQNAGLLPIVLLKANYDAMMNGTTSDQYTYNTSTGEVTPGADGAKESMIYPVSAGNAGNWGTINIGVSSNSTSVLGSQIRYGVTPSQLRAEFPPDGFVSLDHNDAGSGVAFHTFTGDPGISAGIKDDLTSIIGKPVTIPIYDQTDGNGNNAWYRVIDFATVRIVYVDFHGNPKFVVVQPAVTRDPTAVKGAAQSSWSKGGLAAQYLSR